MEVKTYKKVKSNMYEVVFDNGDRYKLYDDVILKYELLIEKTLDKKKLEKILADNGLLDAYYKALKYINTKMRSELEIRKYLAKYEFSREQIDYTVCKLREEGYLDEKKYVQAYVNDAITLSLNGPKKIKEVLKKLGIDENITDEYLEKISDDEWIERIKKIVDKKAKINKAGERVFKSKVYSDLIILGYYSEDVKTVLEGYSLDTKDAFDKEADKCYNKLSTKYTGVELELRFKQKMFAKGFDGETISEFLSRV